MFVLLAIGVCVPSAWGREISVSAGVTAQQEYDSNYYRTHDNPEEAWISTLSPTITILSRGQFDGLSLTYTPGYARNLTMDTYDFQHQAQMSVYQNISSRLKLSASEVFSKSNDPERAKTADFDLTDRRGRRKYWVNTAHAEGVYTYYANSLLTLGYSNNLFHEEVELSDNYERHSPTVSVAHQFSEHWQTNVAYAYTKGEFERSSDLVMHAPSLTINYIPVQTTKIFGTYSYSKTNYDGPSEDYATQNGMIGFSYQFDANTSGALSSGKYYISRKIGADNDGYSYDANLIRKYHNGDLAFSGKGGVENRQFSAAGEGLTKFWTVQGSGSYRFTEDWSSSVTAFYRENKYTDRIPETQENSVGGSAGITCSFLRWYRISLRYSFAAVNADTLSNDYKDHRVVVELAANRELWRW